MSRGEIPSHVRPVCSTPMKYLVSHIAQALIDDGVELLYCDEMKFLLTQTCKYRWQIPRQTDGLTYNQRPVEDVTLTAIAMCSTTDFIGVQIFKGEVDSISFLGFLNEVLSRLPAGKKYSVILDNATWHKAAVVRSADVNKFLMFNEPTMWELNIIENAFLRVRNSFRRRPIVHSLTEEVTEILRCFFDIKNESRFRGYMLNYMRSLIAINGKHD